MMKNATTAVMGVLLIALASWSVANTVFTWTGRDGRQVYSDTPRNLSTRNVNTMNVRSQTVTQAEGTTAATDAAGSQITATPVAEGEEASLSDQQAALNAKIDAQNKKQEAENKKIAEANQQAKAENCTRAKINLQNVQTSNRVSNREQLASAYQKDIERYCD